VPAKSRANSRGRVDEYLSALPPGARGILLEIRRIVKRTVPAATETISYRMPAFRLERIFIYVAAFKSHIGIYPPVKGDKALAKALAPYRGPKGNLKFPLDRPVPYALISRVVRALSRERST
jgi:uncharacterized protein YdhG (YjbR/CyaY superfamily)